MMISEFIERTGFEPTASEYAKIEKAYYDFNGNKDEFCKAFVKNGGEKKIYKARAEEIAQLKSQLVEMEKQHTPIYLSFDNGYTYGGITEGRFEENYGEDNDDE